MNRRLLLSLFSVLFVPVAAAKYKIPETQQPLPPGTFLVLYKDNKPTNAWRVTDD